MVKGIYTLLITPFDNELKLNKRGLRMLVKRQIDAGVQGIAPLGVTGENTLLSETEVRRVLEIVLEEAGGKAKVVPDTCTDSLSRTLKRIRCYSEIGCDYICVYVPYLLLPTEGGIISFYERIADESNVAIVIHNSPGRVVINLSPETIARLSSHPNIVGIKDGCKLLDHLAKVIYLTRNEDFDVFTGKDTTLYPLLSFGGSGSFSVAGNLVPEIMGNIFKSYENGETEKAREIHYSYYDLFEALRFETNPMATKAALNMMELPAGGLRLPLTELSEPKKEQLKIIMQKKGLL